MLPINTATKEDLLLVCVLGMFGGRVANTRGDPLELTLA